MKIRPAALALVALLAASAAVPSQQAQARGGRTTAADCQAGSDDPDCPDPPPQNGKTQSK
jgi:hypothetical protein